MENYIADIQVSPIKGLGPLGFEGTSIGIGGAGTLFVGVLTTVVGLLTTIAFIFFLIKLFIGGIGYLSSGGDKAKVAEARGNITFALIGFVTTVSAIFIAALVGYIFGVDFLNITDILLDLNPY